MTSKLAIAALLTAVSILALEPSAMAAAAHNNAAGEQGSSNANNNNTMASGKPMKHMKKHKAM